MIEKKQVMKSKPVCKVTFKLSPEQVHNAKNVAIAGDFNSWNETSNPFKKAKDGSFSVTVEMQTGTEHQFRYLVDGKSWLNEADADSNVINNFGSENSVIKL
jgi:1,4-alpha-glucan branching enzyme